MMNEFTRTRSFDGITIKEPREENRESRGGKVKQGIQRKWNHFVFLIDSKSRVVWHFIKPWGRSTINIVPLDAFLLQGWSDDGNVVRRPPTYLPSRMNLKCQHYYSTLRVICTWLPPPMTHTWTPPALFFSLNFRLMSYHLLDIPKCMSNRQWKLCMFKKPLLCALPSHLQICPT